MRINVDCDRHDLMKISLRVRHQEGKFKAWFKCRTSHVPNLMLMNKIYCSCSIALDSAHVKFDV